MGRIFTPRQVRLHHVPRLEAFAPLVEKYQSDLPAKKWFVGGVLFGSVLRGAHTVRSDIDLFVVCQNGTEQQAIGYLRYLDGFARAKRIPVNTNLVTPQELATGRHTIGEGFLAHLRWAEENGGRFKGTSGEASLFSSILLKSRHKAKGKFAAYLAHKIRKLREYICHRRLAWKDEDCDMLANIAMAPVHATRRWLALNNTSPHGGSDDVLRALKERDANLGTQLEALILADAKYGDALNSYLHGRNEDQYVAALCALERKGGDAIAYLAALSS